MTVENENGLKKKYVTVCDDLVHDKFSDQGNNDMTKLTQPEVRIYYEQK